MKQSEAKDFLPIIRAWSEGKTLQMQDGGEWFTLDSPNFSGPLSDYRIKPEPKLRAWKPEEVPVGALLRLRDGSAGRWLITGTDCGRVKYGQWQDLPEEQFNFYEHSLDGGKTWLPCGVIEDSQ